jgi:perosamine synthetase
MFIPHNRPTIGIDEIAGSQRALLSGWLAQGNEIKKFENEFCKFLGLPEGHAVAVSSGTAGLYLSTKIIGKKSYIFPIYVCSAVRNAVAMNRKKGKAIDVGDNSPNLTIDSIEKANGATVIVPHMFGIPVNVDGIEKPIIEDCAQSLGAKIKGKSVGLYGEMGVFSFYASKIITTGGHGGMVVSKNKDYIDEIRDYINFDCRLDDKFRFNFQMTELQAGVGRAQLKQLPEFIKRRKEIFYTYKEAFHRGGSYMLETSDKEVDFVPYRAVLKFYQPGRIIASLAKDNIKSIIPIMDWELMGNYRKFPNAYKLTQSTVSLPIYPSLTDEQVKKIISAVNRVLY